MRKTEREKIQKYVINNQNLPDYFRYLAREKKKGEKKSDYWFKEVYKRLIQIERFFKL